ncbi:MAG: hypothetical protein LQ338_003914 [Usnochroma carphineum]|nr:MAG: hypothetical protein LQ338_003914 [Usnochroma carphineum]
MSIAISRSTNRVPSAIQPQNPQGLNQVVVDLTTGDDPPSQSGNHGNVEEYTSNVKQERAVGATPPPQVVSSGKSAQATRPPSPLSILLPATEESQIDPPTERARSSSLIDVSEDEDPKEHHLWDIEQWDPRIHGEADDDNTPMDDAARASLSGCGVVYDVDDADTEMSTKIEDNGDLADAYAILDDDDDEDKENIPPVGM